MFLIIWFNFLIAKILISLQKNTEIIKFLDSCDYKSLL